MKIPVNLLLTITLLKIVLKIWSYLLDLSWITNYISTKILNYVYRTIGFKIEKFQQEEVADSLHMSARADFEVHARNLELIRENKVPVILAYGKDDPLIENAIFSELAQILGLKTINELADLNQECGKIVIITHFS